jgi:protein O-mannosyl-transferase
VSAIVIALAVVMAYAPGLSTPFQYDDLSTVVENQSIRRLSALGAVLSPPANMMPTSGRPALNLSFAIDYAFTGLNVVGYHATNLALHLVCALLLFVVIRTTAQLPQLGLAAHANVIAAATTAIWAVHPLQTGTVTYISGRSESLMALWYLASLYAAIRAHRLAHRTAWSVGAVIACAIGMSCKESMVTAPVAILLYDRAYIYERWSDALRQRWRLYGGLAATWAILVALLIDAPHSDSAGFSAGASVWTYLLNQALVIPRYLRLTVWPDYLLFAYGEAQNIHLADVGALAAVVPGLVVAAMWLWFRRPALGFPALWVFLTLAPTSSFVPIVTEVGAARRMYLPLAGIAVLFTIAFVTLGETMRRRVAMAQALSPAIIALVIGGALTVTTAAQSGEFASAERLWRGSVERWPSGTAHRNLAAVLLQQGKRSEGAEHLRAAVPFKSEARYLLGLELYDQGRFEEASVELQRAIQELPDDRAVSLNGRRQLAQALLQQRRHVEAARIFAELAAMTPNDLTVLLSRADALLAAGDPAAAHQDYQRILARHPGHLGAMANDGLALVQMHRVHEALPLFHTVAERQPNSMAAQLNLATALAGAQRFVEAVATACRAIAIEPQHPRPRQFLSDLRAAALTLRVNLPECPAWPSGGDVRPVR